MYMFRAYQSPCSGWHWAPQWAQMPNLASRNHAGHWYCDSSDCQSGLNLPGAMARSAARAAVERKNQEQSSRMKLRMAGFLGEDTTGWNPV